MRMVVDLPAPLLPRRPKTSPCSDAEAQVVDRHEGAEALDEVLDLDDARHRPSLLAADRAVEAGARHAGAAWRRACASRPGAQQARSRASSSSEDGDHALAIAVLRDPHVLARGLQVALGHLERRAAAWRGRARAAVTSRRTRRSRSSSWRSARRRPGRAPGPSPPTCGPRRRRCSETLTPTLQVSFQSSVEREDAQVRARVVVAGLQAGLGQAGRRARSGRRPRPPRPRARRPASSGRRRQGLAHQGLHVLVGRARRGHRLGRLDARAGRQPQQADAGSRWRPPALLAASSRDSSARSRSTCTARTSLRAAMPTSKRSVHLLEVRLRRTAMASAQHALGLARAHEVPVGA